MKISSTLLTLVLFSGVGCRGVDRLLGQDHNEPAPYTNINPDDYFITGTSKTDHDHIHVTVPGHKLVSVEILRKDGWYTLQRPDIADDYKDSYQFFTIPSTGIVFGNLAWIDEKGEHYTSDPSAPIGTQYRLHIVKA